jgi:hypothetical protein
MNCIDCGSPAGVQNRCTECFEEVCETPNWLDWLEPLAAAHGNGPAAPAVLPEVRAAKSEVRSARLCGGCQKPILSSLKADMCRDCRRQRGIKKSTGAVQFVYVIGAMTGPVKIGISVNPTDRLAQLCSRSDTTAMPSTIDLDGLRILYTVAGDKRLEQQLHLRFHGSRVIGEWFDLGTPDEACKLVEAEVLARPALLEVA